MAVIITKVINYKDFGTLGKILTSPQNEGQDQPSCITIIQAEGIEMAAAVKITFSIGETTPTNLKDEFYEFIK